MDAATVMTCLVPAIREAGTFTAKSWMVGTRPVSTVVTRDR